MTSSSDQTNDISSNRQASRSYSEIGQQMAKGTGWTVGARLGVQGIGFVSTVILARILVPADFGLVALAGAASAALQALSEFSFDVVLIQNQRADREDYDTAWTLSLFRNLFIAACLALGAGVIAGFFGDPRIKPILYIIAVIAVLDGCQNIGIVDFRKDLAFHKDTILMILGKLGGFFVTIPLAFLWRNYWALVAGLVAGSVARLALSFMMHAYRPQFRITRWREIMHFSKWLVLNNISSFIFARSDTVVIGRFAGAQAVGVYNIANDIAGLVSSILLAPLRRAIFPGYAKVSNEPDSLRKAYIDVLALVMLVGAPIPLGIGLVAQPLVRVMLGPHWLTTIPVIEVLALNGFLSLLTVGTAPIFLATGNPRNVLWVQILSSMILVPALVIGVWHLGALGAAWAMFVSGFFTVGIDLAFVLPLLNLRASRLVTVIWRPTMAAAIMAVAVEALELNMAPLNSLLGSAELLVVAVVVGIVCYPLSIIVLWAACGRPEGAERVAMSAIAWMCRKRPRRT